MIPDIVNISSCTILHKKNSISIRGEEILYCDSHLLQPMRKLLVLVILFVVFTFSVVNSNSINIAYAYVDITSPSKGQQIPVATPLIIKGTSTSANESNHCTVSVIINSNFPYHKVTPIGSNGTRDYTTWQFIGNHSYGTVKLGLNRITGKYSCFPNTDTSDTQPDFVKHHSVNIIGIAANNDNNKSLATVKPVSSNTSARYVSNESKPKTLLISFNLENPVKSGSNQTIETNVHDGSNVTIAGAKVNGTVMNSVNTPVTNFTGITNQSGIFSYTWKIDKDYKSGPFTVGLYASANGYQHQLTPTTAVFNVTSVNVHKSSSGTHKSSHHHSSHSSDSGSSSSNHDSSNSEHHTSSSDHHSSNSDSSSSDHSHTLSIIHIPHIHFPHIHTPKLPFS
jgi:hypothetical protein